MAFQTARAYAERYFESLGGGYNVSTLPRRSTAAFRATVETVTDTKIISIAAGEKGTFFNYQQGGVRPSGVGSGSREADVRDTDVESTIFAPDTAFVLESLSFEFIGLWDPAAVDGRQEVLLTPNGESPLWSEFSDSTTLSVRAGQGTAIDFGTVRQWPTADNRSTPLRHGAGLASFASGLLIGNIPKASSSFQIEATVRRTLSGVFPADSPFAAAMGFEVVCLAHGLYFTRDGVGGVRAEVNCNG